MKIKGDDYLIIDQKNKLIPKIETNINPFKITNESIKNISLKIFSDKKNSLKLKSTKDVEFETEIFLNELEISNFLENLKIVINFENSEQFEKFSLTYKINLIKENENFEIHQKLEIYKTIPTKIENSTLSFQSGISKNENLKILKIEDEFFSQLKNENKKQIKISFAKNAPIWLKTNFLENELFFQIEIPLELNNNQNLSFFIEIENLEIKSNLIEFWMIENDMATSNFSKYFIITLYFLISISMFIVIIINIEIDKKK